MENIKKYTYKQITDKLNGKTVRFISDCKLFPNFDVTGKVMSFAYAKSGNMMINVKLKSNNKYMSIDTNMRNLRFVIVK